MTGLTVGFLGTGIMGAPMAGHLAQAVHRVRGWNRSAQRVPVLFGIEQAQTSAAAARGVLYPDVPVSGGDKGAHEAGPPSWLAARYPIPHLIAIQH